MSERRLCGGLALARSTYRRWNCRLRQGHEPIQACGPKKLAPLPLEKLKAQLVALPHRAKRTVGSATLHVQYSQAISRRHFHRLVHECRAEHHRLRRQELRQVNWHSPNLAWAIDGAEYGRDGQGQKLLFIAAQDLASGHRFAPLPALKLTGAQAAEYLEQLFRQHGPPLILKRDNGSIFNDAAVQEVLARWHVLPLNSPANYPRYNGAIEKGIRELKDELPMVLQPPQSWQMDQVKSILAALCLQHNTRPRRRLQGRSACEAFYCDRSPRYRKSQRLALFKSILSDACARVTQMEEPSRRDFHAVWREATVHWLVCQNLISLSSNPKNVTPFSKNVDS